jgi:wyosine [tRNA(Phe)-imidazoG37] synthetase (radical SAM superfamily)
MTNGLLLTPRVWDQIRMARPAIAGVSISVDAATSETYRLNRGADFQRLMDNLAFLSQLVEAGQIWVELSFVVQANNYREMPQFVELARRFGFDSVLFQRLVQWPDTFAPTEFTARAVHMPSHPAHGDFLNVLAHPVMKDLRVDLSNLQNLTPCRARPSL